MSAGFLYQKFEFDHPDNAVVFDDDLTAKNYTVAGEYYHRQFTLRVSRAYSDLDEVNNVRSWRLGGLFYVVENTRLGISADHADDKTSYAFRIAHQPALFRNSTEVSLSYEDVGDNDDIYSVSLAYYFDKRPSLVDRDRKYR